MEKECCLQESEVAGRGEEPRSMVEGELPLACFQQPSNYSTPAWNQAPNEECYSLPLENETPHSLASRIYDPLGTDPAPRKLFDIEQKLCVSVTELEASFLFCLVSVGFLLSLWTTRAFLGGLASKESACQCGRCMQVWFLVVKIPRRR